MNWDIPSDLLYTRKHEWVRQEESGILRVGITDYAQDKLGKIVFVELPEIGQDSIAGQSIVVIESVKAVSDLFAPASGSVAAINEQLLDAPELLNEDPYGEGWVLCLTDVTPDQLAQLMTAEQYQTFVQQEEEI